MIIQYLGTAAAEGWPALFCDCDACRRALALGGKNIRSRSQVLIDNSLLVDFPPDSYLHMLFQGLNLKTIEHLIVTHSHQDHFYPLDFILKGEPYAHIDSPQPQLKIYGNHETQKLYNSAMESDDTENSNTRTVYQTVTPFIPFQAGNHKITPLLAKHSSNENCLIYMIESGGARLLYGNDTGIFPQETWDYISGIHFDAVSLDCTCGAFPDGNYHMGLADDITVKNRLYNLGCADNNTKFILTHFSHNGGMLHDELVEVGKLHGFEIAYDGLIVTTA